MVKIEISNKTLFVVLLIGALLVVTGFSYAYGTGTPTVVGHDAGEVDVNIPSVGVKTLQQAINDGDLGGGGSSLWSLSGSDIYYNSGDVGIGTNSPGAKLDVNGNIVSTGGDINGNLEVNQICNPIAESTFSRCRSIRSVGEWVEIEEVYINGNTYLFNTGINANAYERYKITFSGEIDGSGADRRVLIRINEDSTAGNYKSYSCHTNEWGKICEWDDTGLYVVRNGWSRPGDLIFEYVVAQRTGGTMYVKPVGYGQATYLTPEDAIMGFYEIHGTYLIDGSSTHMSVADDNINSLRVILPGGGKLTGKLKLYGSLKG